MYIFLKRKTYSVFYRCNTQQLYVLPTMFLCVLCGSKKKQRLFPYTALTDCFLLPMQRVFTERYGLCLQLRQVQFRPLRDTREHYPFKNGVFFLENANIVSLLYKRIYSTSDNRFKITTKRHFAVLTTSTANAIYQL
jgi:hypothetical protein